MLQHFAVVDSITDVL